MVAKETHSLDPTQKEEDNCVPIKSIYILNTCVELYMTWSATQVTQHLVIQNLQCNLP